MVKIVKGLILLSSLKIAVCEFTWNGDIPFSVGYTQGQDDPELKKNGCDTTISDIETDYDNHLMIGGSTADMHLITDGHASGCRT